MNKKILIVLSILFIAIVGFIAVSATKSSEDPKLGGTNTSFVMFAPSNASSTVTTSSSVVLATSTGRLYAAIVNDSANTVYLGIGTPAVIGKGIRLNANGGSYEINESNQFQGPVYGISSASSNLTITEK